MKKFIAPVLSMLAAGLVGCGDSTSTSSTPATSSPAPAQSDTVAEVQKVVTETAAKAVTEVKKEAQAAVASLGQQLIDSTKGGSTDALLKNISTDLESRLQKLTASLGQTIPSLPAPTATAPAAPPAPPAPARQPAAGTPDIVQSLEAGVKSLLGGKDADAVGALSKITAAKLTPEQTTLAKDVYNAAAAFVTQRNFSSLEGSGSDVGQLVNAVWKGNYTAALQPLQKIYSQTSLTPEQKNLLGATFDQYMPAGWKDTAGTVQQGINTLKKFGL